MIYKVESIKEKLNPIFKKYGVRKAVLFGSYAKGNATKDSDIDILVDSGCAGLKFFGILEEAVTTLNKEVDLIDIIQVNKNSLIEKEINNTGMVIYEK